MSKNKRQMLLFHSGMIIMAYEIHTEEKRKRIRQNAVKLKKMEYIISFFSTFLSLFFFFSSSVPYINSSCNSSHCFTKGSASRNISSPQTLTEIACQLNSRKLWLKLQSHSSGHYRRHEYSSGAIQKSLLIYWISVTTVEFCMSK